MGSAARFALAALFLATTALVSAYCQAPNQDAVRPARAPELNHPAANGHACLDQRERRAEAGKLISLAAAMRAARSRMPGAVVRARLCHGPDGLVYVLTVLARDGKVARITVDAVKGTLVGGL
jgi:hypothetical protein